MTSSQRIPLSGCTFVCVSLSSHYRAQNHMKDFMQSVQYCSILTKIEMLWQILMNIPNIKFHENPFSRSLVVTRWQTDRQTDMAKLIGKFRNFWLRLYLEAAGARILQYNLSYLWRWMSNTKANENKYHSRETDSFSAVQEIPRFLWNPKIRYRVQKSSPTDPILSQLNPVHTFTHYYLNICLLLYSFVFHQISSFHVFPLKTLYLSPL
jgi:hypothetical protein